MPDDLVDNLIGPTPYSSVWLWLAVALAGLTVCWYAGVFWWTAAGRTRGERALIGAARVALHRRRALRAMQTIQSAYRAGELTANRAGAALNEEVRRFLSAATGLRVEYMQVPDIATVAAGALAPAAPVLTDLADAQFNAASAVGIDAVSRAAQDLVREWT
ncbi:hypothetical protein A7U43_03790 [Mycobacterium adipatum]|uniref:Uncharacterized protein n=1 Tax=Mycobacterium adipatum TaxID=1682113 RepID=A0A172UHQ0_9MYCO|nr:hypothetical protein [Mycobacterium adipatum]ANE78578.1 hypothetical protein A7U43_03790 [Mycobacterium adipatum]MBI5734398.1 hypothetical protein [Mycolicibacterium neoaurum]